MWREVEHGEFPSSECGSFWQLESAIFVPGPDKHHQVIVARNPTCPDYLLSWSDVNCRVALYLAWYYEQEK
jgi:hypothetical protein